MGGQVREALGLAGGCGLISATGHLQRSGEGQWDKWKIWDSQGGKEILSDISKEVSRMEAGSAKRE